MNKRNILKWVTTSVLGVGVLTSVILFGNINHANSETIHSSREIGIKDLAVKNFNIDTTKVKQLYRSDLHDNSNVVSKEIKNKVVLAYTELLRDGGLKVGDYTPIYFLEGNNVSIAVEHADGSMTMTKFDISGNGEPTKIHEDSKEAK
ncbi:hypothetical protein [Desulfosporosinus sp. FKA]|uniref:hypothetical protein n=1 Tax=Desulfosporosinus sp. FKA TaxID=1969834 RepID=UPI000B4A359C|nr:hypothetical protein [Desulfosporosinus sp. FKA]